MPIDYRLSKVVIRNFRGIESLELEFRQGFPSVLIGSNNAGKSTVMAAISMALHGGDFYRYDVVETDFFHPAGGERVREFLVQVHFVADREDGYPAIKGVGPLSVVHGVQVKGTMTKDGRMSHSRTLFDGAGATITYAPRTTLSADDKLAYKGRTNVNYAKVNGKLEDLYPDTPEVWSFKPQNIEASLYIWKTGPIAKLSKLMAERYLTDKWEYTAADGQARPMPKAIRNAYGFFHGSVEAFPFWKDDMKPKLEKVFSKYVGRHAKIDLKPDTHLIEEWLAQKLAVSLATDPESVATPLRNMGDGWQSVIRLAALEALCEYPELVRDRIVLLLEEPETHLHPHLRRKVRKVLGALAAKGWTVVYTTHSPEMTSFEEKQVITRLVRNNGVVASKSVHTETIDEPAKLQSKLDDNGAHDFLFGSAAVFCEGSDDTFGIKLGMEKTDVDLDGRSVSVTNCGSCTAIPSFAYIATALGIRWIAITDEDRLPDGSIKPVTERSRNQIEEHRTATDAQCMWDGSLEACLGVTLGKAKPEVTLERLDSESWRADYPLFMDKLTVVAKWIDPAIEI
jgi:ABC-type hemin transport system ATPase subunit